MKKHFVALDTFRGIFALIVAVFHYKSAGLISEFALIKRGDYFVDFFFVLSGFIIYHNYGSLEKGQSQINFLKNRIARLYPLHAVMLFTFLVLEVIKQIIFSYGLFKNPPFERNNLISFLVNLLMLQSFNFVDISWNYPSWSISAELVTYFLFCISIVYISHYSPKWRILCFSFVVLFSLYMIYNLNSSYDIKLTRNFSMFRCTYGFFSGCIIYEIFSLFKGYKFSDKNLMTIIEVLSLIVSLVLVASVLQKYTFIVTVSFSISILVFAFEAGYFSEFLVKNIFVRLGQLSYSIYMTHAIIAIIFEIAISSLHINSHNVIMILLLIYLLTVIKVSQYTYDKIEIKYKNFFRKKKKSDNVQFVNNSRFVLGVGSEKN